MGLRRQVEIRSPRAAARSGTLLHPGHVLLVLHASLLFENVGPHQQVHIVVRQGMIAQPIDLREPVSELQVGVQDAAIHVHGEVVSFVTTGLSRMLLGTIGASGADFAASFELRTSCGGA